MLFYLNLRHAIHDNTNTPAFFDNSQIHPRRRRRTAGVEAGRIMSNFGGRLAQKSSIIGRPVGQ